MLLGMWMTSCPEAMDSDSWVFWKKQFVEIWSWTKRVDFSDLGEASAVCGVRTRVGWVSELKADDRRTVSILEIESLSLLVSKT